MIDRDAFVSEPEKGRIFRMTRAVRVGDANARGRMRLDAVARYLQDGGNDDTLDLGLGDGGAWVCRRIDIAVDRSFPQLRDVVTLSTFCGGAGSRWAERRTNLTTPGGVVETATLWVHLDADTMRPAPLPGWFLEHYGEACGTRRPDHRLHLPGPSADATVQPWPLRTTDFDVLDHVNNAVAFGAVEECWAASGRTDDPDRITVEYLGPLDRGDDVMLRWTPTEQGADCWLTVGDDVRVAARIAATGS